MEKFFGKQKYTWILLIGALAVYFFMRFFFGITLPFLLAFLVIWKVRPFLSKLAKKTHLKETWILGGFVFLIIMILFAVLYVPISGCFKDVKFLEENESILESEIINVCVKKYTEIKETCSQYIGSEMVIKIQKEAVNGVKICVSFFTYIVIFFVSMILICKDFDKIKEKIEENKSNTIIEVIKGVFLYIKVFLKSQVIIFFVLAVLIGMTLWILGVPNGWLLGILAGLLDAFPFVGTGIVLVPISIWLFLKGKLLQAVFCLILYGVCALLRELLEPKLVGEKVGIYPIVLFASFFIGMQIYGVSGIIKGPLSVVIIYELKKVLLAKEKKV